MLTEEEAKTKVCHVTLARHTADGAYGQETHCLGSGCMAWRWEARFGTDPDNPENCAVLPSTHGYCGLAQRPMP